MTEEQVDDKSKWLIVYCSADNSFSLIEKDTEAVCDGNSLDTGDKLKFFFGGIEYDGEVRAMGGDDDYDRLAVLLKELNAKNKKKEDSFHAGEPRKNRGRGRYAEAVKALLQPTKRSKNPKQPTSKSAGESTNFSHTEVVEYIAATSDEASSSPQNELPVSSSSSSSTASSPLPEDISAEEARKSAKAKRKGRDQDVLMVKKLKVNPPSKERPNNNSGSEALGSNSKKSIKRQLCISDSEAGEDATDRGMSDVERDESEEDKSANDNNGESEEEGGQENKSGKKDKTDKKDKNEKKDKTDKKDKNQKQDKTEKKDKNEKQDKTEKKDKNEKQDKTEKKDKNEKKDKTEKKDEHEKNEKTVQRDHGGKKAKTEMKDQTKKEKKIVKRKKADEQQKSDESEDDEEQTENSNGTLIPNFKVLRWSADDDNVEEISGKSKELVNQKFYIASDDLLKAKVAKNASTFAKALLVGAFTDEALFKCSVSGGQYRAGGRDNITQKPPLSASTISVIIDVAVHRQNAKNWNPKLSKKEILAALRQKLVDIRPRLKALFEV